MNSNVFPNDINNILLKRRKFNILLSDYQVSILEMYGIDYNNFNSMRELLFLIEDVLSEEYSEDLDIVGNQISEFIYYNVSNK